MVFTAHEAMRPTPCVAGATQGVGTEALRQHLGVAVRQAADELLEEEAGLVLGQEPAVREEVEQLASRRVLHHDCQVAGGQKYLHVWQVDRGLLVAELPMSASTWHDSGLLQAPTRCDRLPWAKQAAPP